MPHRNINKLAAVSLRQLPAGMHGDGGGLWLDVRAAGSRVWIFRFTRHGRAHSMGMGPLNTISLSEARVKAREARKLLLEGIDPLAARAAKRKPGLSFRDAAESYVEAHSAGWRSEKHRQQWGTSLGTYAFPVIGAMPVDAIDTAAVLRVLKPIWVAKPETASRVRSRVELVLGWATAQGLRAGDNPAAWKAHLQHMLAPRAKVARVEHHAALPHSEVAGFVAELRAVPGVAARALELLVLTASRTAEVLGATWAEIDLEAAQWVIPGSRMKNQRDHRVPLSEPALAILTGLATDNQETRSARKVFGELGPLGMARLLGKLCGAGPTVHGMRASFRSWCADRGVARELAEQALAHSVGSAVEAAYNRSDLFERRRALMSDWASYCDGAGGAKVVQLRAGG